MDTSPPLSTNSSDPETEECHYMYDGSLWKKTHLTNDTYPYLVALSIINLLVLLPTILLNALIILAVATRYLLRTNSNILVAFLAGIHLLGGLVGQPIVVAMELKRVFGDGPFCGIEKAVTVAKLGGAFTSLGIIVLISIDRYISVKNPLRYRIIVSKNRIKTGLFLAWGIGLLVTIQDLVLAVIDDGTELYLQYLKVKDVVLLVLAALYIVIICYTYYYIFKETRRQKKRLQTEQVPQDEAKRLRKENRLTNTLTMILAAFVLSYIPSMILLFIGVCTDNAVQPHILSVVWSWISIINQLGNLLDPFIYFWRMKKLRHAILEILHYRQPENSPPPIEMMEIQRCRRDIQPTTCEAFSKAVQRHEPVLLSFRNLGDAEEIVPID